MRRVAVNYALKTNDLFCFSRPQGSYDHTLKLFDARVDKSVMNMDHGQPVESLLLYPSEGLLVSAGTKCALICLLSALLPSLSTYITLSSQITTTLLTPYLIFQGADM